MTPCSQWQVCFLGKIDTIFFIGKGYWSISVPTMLLCLLPGWMLEKDGRDERQRREEVARRGGRTADVIRCDPVYEATRFLCAKRNKHDAISLGVQSQEISLVYHTSFPHFLLVTPSLLYFQYGLLLLRMRCRPFPLHL